jgi:hypothetical protein
MSVILSLFILLGMGPVCSQDELTGISQKKSDQKFQDLELFLLIGQSNMAGRATIEAADRDSLDRVFLFKGIEGDEWEKAANPFNKYSSIRKDLKMQKLGPGYTFARKMASFNPDKQFGMVVNAKGGTTLDEWLPGTHFYNEALKRVKMAMAYGNLRGVVWHQGEGDINKTESYIERISLLIDSLRVATGISDLPFVAGQLSEDRVARIPFNQMIIHLPEKVKYTGVAITENTSTFDSTHFDTRSQRLLGERYADEMMKLLKNGNH